MGLWNDYVGICIKIYNFKGSKKYDRFYVIDLNFANAYIFKSPYLGQMNSDFDMAFLYRLVK